MARRPNKAHAQEFGCGDGGREGFGEGGASYQNVAKTQRFCANVQIALQVAPNLLTIWFDVKGSMKAFLAGFATAVIAVVLFNLLTGVLTGEWMISSIKSPGLMALTDIQADMNAKRYEIAGRKVDVFLKTWKKFSSGPDSCSGTGIGEIIPMFSEMPGGIKATDVETRASNVNHPVPLETNSITPTVGSGH
jgi:hypothetical protein